MLITSTVEICIQHLGRVEEMVFATRHSYASAVLGVVILSICYTLALWLIRRTYRRYFYTTWKGNPSSQMWFFVQLCSSWQDFNWLKGSCGLSAAAELLVLSCDCYVVFFMTLWLHQGYCILDSRTLQDLEDYAVRCTTCAPTKISRHRSYKSDDFMLTEKNLVMVCLQCFDTVGWVAGRASGL